MKFYNPTITAKITLVGLFLWVSGCTNLAPVQEMSNARQTLTLAKMVNADKYAQEKYIKAQEILDQAVIELNSGDFSEARRLAVQATQEAKQAHLHALNQQKK